MKASELIAHLQAIIDKHGDIQVVIEDYSGAPDTIVAEDIRVSKPSQLSIQLYGKSEEYISIYSIEPEE